MLKANTHAVQALQDVHWTFSVPLHAFHPRAYNLSQDADFTQFDIDFKWTAAAAVLRVLLRDGGFHPLRVPSEEVAQLALAVCTARLAHLRCASAPDHAATQGYLQALHRKCELWRQSMRGHLCLSQ